eukprot:scaffold9510_cov58-Attheya_sp.AAC.7
MLSNANIDQYQGDLPVQTANKGSKRSRLVSENMNDTNVESQSSNNEPTNEIEIGTYHVYLIPKHDGKVQLAPIHNHQGHKRVRILAHLNSSLFRDAFAREDVEACKHIATTIMNTICHNIYLPRGRIFIREFWGRGKQWRDLGDSAAALSAMIRLLHTLYQCSSVPVQNTIGCTIRSISTNHVQSDSADKECSASKRSLSESVENARDSMHFVHSDSADKECSASKRSLSESVENTRDSMHFVHSDSADKECSASKRSLSESVENTRDSMQSSQKEREISIEQEHDTCDNKEEASGTPAAPTCPFEKNTWRMLKYEGGKSVDVNDCDILCGGDGILDTPNKGNQMILTAIRTRIHQFSMASHKDKFKLVRSVVKSIHRVCPPGRFLIHHNSDWHEISLPGSWTKTVSTFLKISRTCSKKVSPIEETRSTICSSDEKTSGYSSEGAERERVNPAIRNKCLDSK